MKKIITGMSNISAKILFWGLPIIIIYFLYIIVSFYTHVNTAQNVLIHIYAPQLEHIIMSFTIIVLSSLLFDITEKEFELLSKK